MRVGLLGGSFDPIHNAHIQMAKYARKQLCLDKVYFVVAKDTPLKQRKLTSFYDRVLMVKQAIQAYRHFKVCTIEADSEGKSYTIDTVRTLQKKYPNDEFYFIIGGDQVAQLDQWYQIDALEKEVHLCAFERNGQTLHTPYRVQALSMPSYAISSTNIRAGHFFDIHKQVQSYAIKKMLYMDFVKDAMSEYRYEHSLRVALLCAQIAKANHMDISKAYLCGLLHDINKEFKWIDYDRSKAIITQMRAALLAYHKGIWHGYLGRFICEHALHIKDHDILLAIENHVLGDCRNKYAMLLYVADKLDPGRDYDTSQSISLCKKDLYAGYKQVRKEQKQYYGEENASGK
ncbi:MAG: nicotinate (nicotinamide) nucleotide adenylyltransferase [Erysipelotrichia bacterium]|nr:nicotinate (nicotinamide) nucleotide adenylyltransferase [Erysipelotrichia bacterium]NCC54281.1 nicotinate (nicotinamide) nucleotide adenylyltransferase [Erysipelotrichia bacterium]